MKGNWLVGFSLWMVATGCASGRAVAPAPTPAAAELTGGGRLIREVPVPNFYRQALESGTRSESGAPGEAYWQNAVSYRIEAEIEPATATIRGTESIVFRNHSPAALPSVVLNLYQNIFAESVPRNRYVPVTGGVTIERVAAQGQTLTRRPVNEIPIATDDPQAPSGYSVQGTLARVRLPRSIAPGDSVVLEIDWQHRIPPTGGFRTAWEDALGSRAFLVAQWYPQVAVHDDLRGWDATPYLGDGEFYLPYGDFDVAITVPAGYLVGATGELTNAFEVLTEEAQRRLTAALSSDTVTRVVTGADLTAENATQPAIGGQHTWHFQAQVVRDFAFATSDGYVWDATRVVTRDTAGEPRTIAVHALYRPGAPNWDQSVRYAQHSTSFLGELVIPYPYPQITIAEGPIGGMEYPMLTFIGRPSSEIALYAVIAHEIAHEWFPMLVGQDEAAYAWMDEGMATYLEGHAVGAYFAIEDPFVPDRESYLNVAGSDFEVPIMRHTDLVSPYGARVVAAYFKPGLLLRSLSVLLGEDVFREALLAYTREWANKHPTPWDFFRTMERFAGTSLDWFFYPWWFETGVLDHAIERVEVDPGGAVVVRVVDLGDALAPAIVVATTSSGLQITSVVPVETWLGGTRAATVTLRSTEPFREIQIDPARVFPDANIENNVWSPVP